MQSVASRLEAVAGSLPQHVSLVAVSKFHPAEAIRQAYDAGQRIFAESRVQEIVAKIPQLPADIRWHFIGHLQTNKVKNVVGRVDMIESVGSVHLLEAVEKQAAKLDIVQDILLEVNVGGEESKSGITPDQVEEVAKLTLTMPHVRLRGLMAIPPVAGEDGNRGFFREMYQLYVDIKQKMVDNNGDINCLSMGMSGDYMDAVREGATLVRVGTALFGARAPVIPRG